MRRDAGEVTRLSLCIIISGISIRDYRKQMGGGTKRLYSQAGSLSGVGGVVV